MSNVHMTISTAQSVLARTVPAAVFARAIWIETVVVWTSLQVLQRVACTVFLMLQKRQPICIVIQLVYFVTHLKL